jgi:predicted permease
MVPRERRDEWAREWEAEVAHRAAAPGGRGWGAASVAAAALEDALGLRLRASGPVTADLGTAFRGLRRAPTFSAIVVITLGIGIGANAAIFSAVHAVLLRPLPYDPSRLAVVDLAFGPPGERRSIPASGPEFLELRAENEAFEALAGYIVSDVNLGGAGEPARVTAAAVTADFLRVLGAEPLHGRGFAAGEDLPGEPPVAVLAHGLWQRMFGGDPAAVGAEVLVNGSPMTVVGVLSEEFSFPGARVDLLRPMSFDPANPGGRSSHGISMVARLAPGIDLASARTRTDALVARWAQVHPDRHGPNDLHPVILTGVREAMAGDARLPLLILFAAVAVVLMVACLNVTNLLLARGEGRRREMAVRVALGAGHGALIRQLLAESGLLSLAGGAVGVALAAGGIRVLSALGASVLPAGAEMRLDGRVILFTGVVAILTALFVGLAPAWGGVRGRLALPGGAATRATAARGALLVRKSLVVAQVAAAVALVSTTSVLARGLGRLVAVDPGFDFGGTLTLDLSLPPASYPDVADVAAFHARLAQELESLPQIRAVGSMRTAPMSGAGGFETISVPGRPSADDSGEAFAYTVQYQVADPGTFEAFGIPLLAGRSFGDQDEAGATLVTIVNESAARVLFGGEDPLRRFLRMGGGFPDNPNPPLMVVGVVEDVRQAGLDQDLPPQMYVPRSQSGSVYGGLGARFATLAVRTGGDARAVAPLVRQALRRLDPGLPVASVMTLEERVQRSVGDRRFVVVLMAAFALVAVGLGALGLYGLMAYVVSTRTREIGIRVALGAKRAWILRSVLVETATLVVAGSALGVLLAVASAAPTEALTYEVGARDPLALAGAPLVLLATALLAASGPALRALRIEATEALRSE